MDEYTKEANDEEKKGKTRTTQREAQQTKRSEQRDRERLTGLTICAVLANTEEEAALARKWVLKINQQDHLVNNTIVKNWNAPEVSTERDGEGKKNDPIVKERLRGGDIERLRMTLFF